MEQLDLGYVKLMLINLSLAGLTVPCNARFGLQASRQSHSELGNFQCKTSRSRWPASSSASAKDFLCRCMCLPGWIPGIVASGWPPLSSGAPRPTLVAVQSPYSRSEPTRHLASSLAQQRQITAQENSGQGSICGRRGTASSLNSPANSRGSRRDHQLNRKLPCRAGQVEE